MPITPFDSEPNPLLPRVGPAAPTMPTFGGAAPMPMAPEPITVPGVTPRPPAALPNFMVPPTPQAQRPDFLSAALPIAISAIAGKGDPSAIGQGLAAFMKGQDLRRQAMETQQQRDERKRLEQAEFYTRAMQAAQAFEDPADFESWRTAIAPVAQLHGIDPNLFQFSDQKRVAKAKKDARALIDTLRKTHGDVVDDPAWQKAHNIDGRSVAEWYAVAEMPTVTDASGSAVAPSRNVFKADNPNELKIRAYADSLGKRPEQLSAEEIQAAVDAGKPTKPENAPAIGSFEDYVTRKFGPNPTPQQIEAARKAYNQADDRPRTTDGGPSDSQRFSMTERLAGAWTKSNAPVKEVDRQIRIMRSGLANYDADPNGSSQSILVTFQRILDPMSVVRESEYARTIEGQALLDQWYGKVKRAIDGGTTLSKPELNALLKTAEGIFGSMQEWNSGTRRRIEGQAQEYGIRPELVFDDAIAPADPKPKPAPKPAPAGGTVPKVIRYDMNGNPIK